MPSPSRIIAICHSESSKASASSRVLPIRHFERSEKSVLWFVRRLSTRGVDFADGVVGFASAGFPTVKYLRNLSSRFGPSPRIASKSSTLLKAPYDLRICKILSAVADPIPGTCCRSSDVAVLRFTGLAGGFFFPASMAAAKIKPAKRKEERTRIGYRRAMTAIYCSD